MDFPTLPFDIVYINQQLERLYGVDTITGQPIWRVSWSTDQYEKRRTDFTPEGLQLLHPQVYEFPKYQWCKDRWLLERLCLVPDVNADELLHQKVSYECMQYFEHARTGDAIVPSLQACKFIVDTVYAAMGKKSLRKYVDEEAKNPEESRDARINKLTEELFGDESFLLGRTITGEAVAYTGEPKFHMPDKPKLTSKE